MRKIVDFNQNWLFTKELCTFETIQTTNQFRPVTIPHTWNHLDGQDGGSDYYRNTCWYKKEFSLSEETAGKQVYIEFAGVNSIAEVYLNGNKVAKHEGGFSTFRADLTPFLSDKEQNELYVSVNNAVNDFIYPQMADFTFFGGIYRNVKLILVEESHFDLDYHGSQGIQVSASVEDEQAFIKVETYISNPQANQQVVICIYSQEEELVETKKVSALEARSSFVIPHPHLWNGREDPYCYKVTASLQAEIELDAVSVPLGIRTFHVDPVKGFFLNGKPYPLRGVSRHQDREDMGWAITQKEQEEDIQYIAEVGANTIRLAHYQHDAFFYELCDRYGMVVWAEIPFISSFMENGYDNTISQMKELVVQNAQHPSIFFWGIANEISMGGEPDLLQENLRELNDLAHALDPSRLTTIANASMTKFDSEHNFITDIVAYNHYYGWYGGTIEDNGKWFDEYHQANPDIPIGLSEYGAEGILKYHNHNPKIRDYSEEYQSLYHEKMLEMIETRPYIWGTYIWNMFDFAADGRDEGGVKGRNNKGLMTFDRSTKKDSFYICKAYWTSEPFVHICSRRFYDRPEERTPIKVYSNCDTISLEVDGQAVATVKGEKVFHFSEVALEMGENQITAIGYRNGAEESRETIALNRVTEPNPEYILNDELEGEGADNWFVEKADGTVGFFEFPEGYYSINNTIEEIMTSPAGMETMMAIIGQTSVQGNQKELLDYLKGYTVKALLKLTMGSGSNLETLLMINEKLNQIPRVTQEV